MKWTTISSWFDDTASRYGSKTAVQFLRNSRIETVLSYSELSRDINGFAGVLQSQGILRGDRVILLLQKSLIALTAHLALQKLGAISVPLNPGFKKNELDYLLNDADASLIILDPEKAELIGEIQPGLRQIVVSTRLPYQELDLFKSAPAAPIETAIKPDDPGLIIYTSGTTGNPKGAMLTQRNLVHDAQNIISIWGIRDTDVLCHALPLFHVHGLCFAVHTLLLSGGQILMLDAFRPDVVIDVLSGKTGDATCTVFMAVPAMYTRLMDTMADPIPDFGHIRLLTSGSAPLPVPAFERIKATFGREPVEREGMSETGMNFSNPLAGVRKPGAIGLPLPGLEVRVVDPETHADVEPGQVGELWLKSPSITPGYWRKPVETAATFENGWFKTGDLGKVDDDGYYYLTDRIKHIIITGGENVSAREVETVINQVKDVVESCVVGISDEKWGEKVVAVVVVKPESTVTEAEIIAFCREHLHDWKCPKRVLFQDEIPRNTMGKMLKEAVKKYFQ